MYNALRTRNTVASGKMRRNTIHFGECCGGMRDGSTAGAERGWRNAFFGSPSLAWGESKRTHVTFCLRRSHATITRKHITMKKVLSKIGGLTRSNSTAEAAGEHDPPSAAVAAMAPTRKFSISRFSLSSVQPTKPDVMSVSYECGS